MLDGAVVARELKLTWSLETMQKMEGSEGEKQSLELWLQAAKGRMSDGKSHATLDDTEASFENSGWELQPASFGETSTPVGFRAGVS